MKNSVRRRLLKILCFLLPFLPVPLCAQDSIGRTGKGFEQFYWIESAYPDVTFNKTYDTDVEDWRIEMIVPDGEESRTTVLYWAHGRMLPKELLADQYSYWQLLYSYPKTLADPADFSEEQKEKIKHFGSDDNRRNSSGTPMYFFDALYDSGTRASLETKIKKTTFLGHKTSVHERIVEPLSRVEQKILALAENSNEVKNFVGSMKSCDAYYWRIIAGTTRKSFHSLGIAVDILPVKTGDKQIFWGWAKDKYPTTWMLVPLKNRWMPPDEVIRIFEAEGFIWGGKWAVYDNMHFEYHPELIKFNFLTH